MVTSSVPTALFVKFKTPSMCSHRMRNRKRYVQVPLPVCSSSSIFCLSSHIDDFLAILPRRLQRSNEPKL